MSLDLARLEPTVVGEIITRDGNFAEWEINWSKCKSLLYSCSDRLGPSVSSPNFPSEIGTCWFKILKFRTCYKLHLFTNFAVNGRSIRLSVKGDGNYISSPWIDNWDPGLEFDGNALAGSEDSVLRITYIALNAGGNSDGSSTLNPKPTLKQKDWNGKRTRGWIAEEESMPKDTPPDAGPAGAEGTEKKAPKSKGFFYSKGMDPQQHEDNEKARRQEALKAKSAAKLISDLGDLLLNTPGDVILKVEGEERRAHKFMLAARSPKLAKIFSEPEKVRKIDKYGLILKIDRKVFVAFLWYLYTGTVQELSTENSHLLYEAAVKYELPQLKELCLEHMKSNVVVDNFCDILEVSLLHCEEELYGIAAKFFVENQEIISETDDFTAFMVDYPVEANKLFNQRKKEEQPVPNRQGKGKDIG